MLSCLVPPRFGQEDQITMPSSTAFSLQFPSLASSLHHAEKQHFENASNYHSNTTPSPPISTKSPIGGTVSAVDQHISNAQTQQHYHSYLTQQQQQQQHQEQQRQHHHAMAMAIANMAAANGGVGGGAKSPSTLNGYDEGGRSTSSPGSSTTMGDLCSAHIGPMTGPGGPHACAQCSTAFPTREMLEKHEMMHSPNTTVCCKVCHKTFANVYRLQRHMISHDESVLLRKFKCTECDKAFKFKHHLKEHVRIHSGEKPFACDNCGKRFSHSGSYSSHMTSKKCISMGLKLNNNRSMMKSLEKVAPLGLGMAGSPSNSKRPGGGGGLSQNPMSYFPPGLPNIAGLNNNPVTNSNNNAFYPMIPKYSNYDAMNAALLASLQNPFYSMGLNPRIHPYSITRLLELTAAGNNRLQADPEDMIEEVTEDVVDDQKLVMDLEEQDESKTDKSGRNSPMNGTYDRSSPDQQNNSTHEHQLSKDEAQDRINHDDDDDDEDDCEESSPSPGRESPEIKVEECADEETLQCARCAKKFNHRTELVQHEKVLCGMFNSTEQQQQQRRIDHQQSEPEAINTSYFQSGSEEDAEDRESKAGSEGERKVRVRTALTEEQQSFFKEQYAINPRPTRDEFRMIGLRLNLDPRVVQVWFQNNRSRERKMNTYKPPFTSPVLGQSISPAYSPATAAAAAVPTSNSGAITNNHNANGGEDQPLDLSVKKEIVTPSTSPRYGLAPHQTDSSTPEAINLSRKWSRSPTPFGSARYYNASTPSHRGATSNELSSLIRHTPSPNEAVSRHAAHPNPYVLPPGARSLVPMECLFQMTPEYAEYARSLKLGGLKLGERGTSLSPGSEKRSWRDDDSRISHDDEYNFHASKRIKLETSGNSDLDCPFVCDQCDKAFSKQSSLARHKYEHSGQRPYKCEECPKAFKHKHHLTEHKRLHSGEKPFQCTKCLKRFSHSGSYSQHMNHRYSYCKPYRE